MAALPAWKAETLMGRAFRYTFDKETFYALLKHVPEWKRCEQMVRCTRGIDGDYTFHIRLAKKGPGLLDEIMVTAHMTMPEFAVATEERFADMGKAMAEKANREIENTYMKIDNE
jgi:hypothetical protein